MAHNWSGWPGAHCQRCRMPDVVEEAIGLNLFEPWDGIWVSKEAEEVCEYLRANCPADLNEHEMVKFNDMVRRYNEMVSEKPPGEGEPHGQ